MSRRGVFAFALSALLLTGCFTGKRPHFNDDPFPPGAMTGDAAVDAVLAKLDAVTSGPATASFSVLTKFGNTTNTALVSLLPGRRSITIGNVRYLQTETTATTCTVDLTVPCIDGFEPARISDIGVTVDFYAADTAIRLRRDEQAKVAPTTAHVETIAEQQSTCVDVPLPGGVAVYCVLDTGIIAKLDDGDVLIMLTLFSPAADDTQFAA